MVGVKDGHLWFNLDCDYGASYWDKSNGIINSSCRKGLAKLGVTDFKVTCLQYAETLYHNNPYNRNLEKIYYIVKNPPRFFQCVENGSLLLLARKYEKGSFLHMDIFPLDLFKIIFRLSGVF